MMMFVAFTLSFTLTSCGEEVIIDDAPTGRTTFSASPANVGGEDGTRTLLDKNFVYSWQGDDQIWVNDAGTWRKSSTSQLDPSTRSASFYYDKLLTANSYQVVYTGHNSNSATQVTISANLKNFTTNTWKLIGANGDCGVATATRVGGTGEYSFRLQHKASYLGIAPMKTGYLNKNYRWTKIEIADVKNRAIAGTFDFSTAGIDTTKVTSPSSTITMTPGEGYEINLQSYASDYDYIFVAIPPCYRELKITYYFVRTDNPNETMKVVTKMKPQKFFENNVMKVHYPITPDYYRWDAPNTEPYDALNSNASTAADFSKATKSCASMPNPNEMYWYISGGDPRWDGETEWTDDDGVTKYKGGVWIKKKQYITGFSSTVGAGGVDMRTTEKIYSVNSATYISGKKPANTSQYFFLPALGYYNTGTNYVQDKGILGSYWSSYAGAYNTVLSFSTGYRLLFSTNSISVSPMRRQHAFIAGNGADWFK